MKKIAVAFAFFLTGTTVTNAQNYFSLLNDGRHIISAGTNANPQLNAHADFLMGFDHQSRFIERYGIVAHANFPLFSQRGLDFDLRLGAGALISFADRFKSIAGLSWNFSRTADINGRYFHSGFKLDFLPGYYGNKWVFAPHFSFQYQPWIHIKHSEYAINAFRDLYPNNDGSFKAPKDGWFYQNHITLQTGVGIVYFQPNWHLNLTAGFQHQPNRLGIVALPDIGIMPFYGGVNFGYVIKNKKQ